MSNLSGSAARMVLIVPHRGSLKVPGCTLILWPPSRHDEEAARRPSKHDPPEPLSTGPGAAHLRKPALAATIVLGVAERLASPARDAEVEFLHVLIVGERLGLAVEHHAAVLENVAVARVAERHVGVLLG